MGKHEKCKHIQSIENKKNSWILRFFYNLKPKIGFMIQRFIPSENV